MDTTELFTVLLSPSGAFLAGIPDQRLSPAISALIHSARQETVLVWLIKRSKKN
jgi:hypothetical protein